MDPAILCSPVYVSASFTILKLCSRVPSPLTSFHHKPTKLLRYGRLFMLTMPGQEKALTKDKSWPSEVKDFNQKCFPAAVQPPTPPRAGLIERTEPLNLGADLVTSTLASFTAAGPAQLSRQNILAPESKADNLAIPDLRAKFKASQLPVPLVSQCCHPNSPWQPPPLHLLARTPYSFGGVHRPFPEKSSQWSFLHLLLQCRTFMTV